jgi:hypothetical protein
MWSSAGGAGAGVVGSGADVMYSGAGGSVTVLATVVGFCVGRARASIGGHADHCGQQQWHCSHANEAVHGGHLRRSPMFPRAEG